MRRFIGVSLVLVLGVLASLLAIEPEGVSQDVHAPVSRGSEMPANAPVLKPQVAPELPVLPESAEDGLGINEAEASVLPVPLPEIVPALRTLPPPSETYVSPVQKRILDGLIARARADNEREKRRASADGLQLRNLAVVGTTLTYYYTISTPYDQINHARQSATQKRLIRQSICNNGAVATLAETYGISYAYVFASQDNRLVARIERAHELCQ